MPYVVSDPVRRNNIQIHDTWYYTHHICTAFINENISGFLRQFLFKYLVQQISQV